MRPEFFVVCIVERETGDKQAGKISGSFPLFCPDVFRRRQMLLSIKNAEPCRLSLQTKTVGGQTLENQQVYI